MVRSTLEALLPFIWARNKPLICLSQYCFGIFCCMQPGTAQSYLCFCWLFIAWKHLTGKRNGGWSQPVFPSTNHESDVELSPFGEKGLYFLIHPKFLAVCSWNPHPIWKGQFLLIHTKALCGLADFILTDSSPERWVLLWYEVAGEVWNRALS